MALERLFTRKTQKEAYLGATDAKEIKTAPKCSHIYFLKAELATDLGIHYKKAKERTSSCVRCEAYRLQVFSHDVLAFSLI